MFLTATEMDFFRLVVIQRFMMINDNQKISKLPFGNEVTHFNKFLIDVRFFLVLHISINLRFIVLKEMNFYNIQKV